MTPRAIDLSANGRAICAGHSQKPLLIELFAGLHGWGIGAIVEGFRVVGFDVVDMCTDLGIDRPSGDIQLVLQDVLTLHGAQFKDAALIVASPPCQAYSYRAMPWKRAKALPPPSNELFDACFRIQREALEAAGHHVPMVVENVCGAQKWVGRARWHYGSFYLWGDVPALMPMTRREKVGGLNWSSSDKPSYKAQAFNSTAEQRLKATKNDGGSWFNIAHNTTSGTGQNPDGRTTSGLINIRDGHSHTRHLTNQAEHDGVKGVGCGSASWQSKEQRHPHDPRNYHSKSSGRKAASAHIAKIPLALARHIAAAWKR